jgi:hypothetical protein
LIKSTHILGLLLECIKHYKKEKIKKMSKAKEMIKHYKKGLDFIAKKYPDFQIDEIRWSQMNYGKNAGLDFEIVVSYRNMIEDTQPTYIITFKSKAEELTTRIYKAIITSNGHFMAGEEIK